MNSVNKIPLRSQNTVAIIFFSTVFVWISWACWENSCASTVSTALWSLHSRTVPKSRHQSRFCQEIRPPLPSSAEETTRLTPFFEFCESQLFWYPPCTELTVTQSVRDNSIQSSPRSLWKFFRKFWYRETTVPRTHLSTFWTSSSVTTECRPWPPSSCTSMRPSLNILYHSVTQLSLITLPPYTRHNRRWISAALCPSAWRKRITACTSQLAGGAMSVSMFRQWLLVHYAAKMYECRRSAITNVTCYYWACALALWQRVSFDQPIRGWFWNCPRISQIIVLICSALESTDDALHELILAVY